MSLHIEPINKIPELTTEIDRRDRLRLCWIEQIWGVSEVRDYLLRKTLSAILIYRHQETLIPTFR